MIEARRRGRQLHLRVSAVLCAALSSLAAPGPVELPLLEASGADLGGPFGSADAVALASALAPGAAAGVAVRGRALVLLGGPTPHVLRTLVGALPPSAVGANATAAATALLAGRAAPSLALLRAGEVLAVDVLDGAPGSVRALPLPPGGAAVALAPALAGANATGVVVLRGDGGEPLPFLLVNGAGAGGALAVIAQSALGTAPRAGFAWRSVGAGFGLLAAARANGSAVEVLLFDAANATADAAWAPPLRASAVVSSPAGAPPLLQAALADVYGDGAPAVLLLFADSSVQVLWLGAGAAPLHLTASFALDPAGAAAARWASAAVGAWLPPGPTVLPAEAQILALRAPPAAAPTSLRASMLVFGRPEHWLRRQASIAGALAQQEFSEMWEGADGRAQNETVPVDLARLMAALASTHSNSYLFLVCDRAPSATSYLRTRYSYVELVRFLDTTRGFAVDGRQLRVWLGLLPPSEAVGDSCVPPPDSPLTSFNETALFEGYTYTNGYNVWGTLAGLLAAQYPHLVAVDIDDFSLNTEPGKPSVFSGQEVALITAGMRASAPWMVLSSVVYTDFTAVPDLALVLDAPVYFFRNEGSDAATRGAGPCAARGCVWGPNNKEIAGGCLAGVCCEPTTFNARAELAAALAGMPAGRQLVAGYYATGHSQLGQPTARYVSRLLQALAMQDGVAGVMTYTLKSAFAPCDAGAAPLFARADGAAGDAVLEREHEFGCIVAHAYAAIAGTAPAQAPAPPAPTPAPAAAQDAGFGAAALAGGCAAGALVGALVSLGASRLLAARLGGARGDAAELLLN